MSDIENRLAALEATVARQADELALYHLVASYAPAVDSGSAREASELWTEDGIYDVDVGQSTGRQEIFDRFDSGLHDQLIHKGCGHVISMPRITVDGDTAVATCHSRLYTWKGDGFSAWRIAANRWEFARTPAGWRITKRTNRLLDGGEAGRALLAAGFADQGAIEG